MKWFFSILMVFSLVCRAQITVTAENDLFILSPSSTDRNFSHGTKITYSTEEIDYSLTQNIYTPTDLHRSDVIKDDRPYCGLLFLGMEKTESFDDYKTKGGVIVGVVGPSALGEETQRFVHKYVNSPDPKGWDHQLDNEVILNARIDREAFIINKPSLYVGGAIRFDVGNLLIDSVLHTPIRVGYNVKEYEDQRITIESLTFKHSKASFGLEVDPAIKFVLHDLTLDGNTFSDSHSIDREYYYWEVSYGAFWSKGRYSVGYEQVWREEQFKGQMGGQRFASIKISF